MENKELTNDHDLLIELRTEMRGLREDVKTLNDNTSIRIADLERNKLDVDVFREKNKDVFDVVADHETRIRDNEKSITKILTWGSAALVALQISQFIISRFLN